MRLVSTLPALAAAAAIAFTPSGPAFAWGNTGHRMVGTLAMQALPAEVPAFLRSKQAAADMGELAREPDRWKGSGKTHDSDRDPAHLMRLDDNGVSLAGMPLDQLPETRTLYEQALRAKGADPVKTGYLYYSTIDAWQQVTKDFAFLRVIALAEAREKDPKKLREYLHIDEILICHHKWWKADKHNCFYDDDFRTCIQQGIDNLRKDGHIT